MKLKKFMFCMRLETIGLVLGFLGVLIGVGSGISAFLYSLFMIVSPNSKEQQKVKEYLADVPRMILIIVSIFVVILFVSAFIYANVQLIKGIRNNQHEKMKLWLVLCRYPTSLIGLHFVHVQKEFHGLSLAIVITLYFIGTSFYIYCYMSVHSLYKNIRDSSQRGLAINLQNSGSLIPTTNDFPEKV